jgi:hypothetical protein
MARILGILFFVFAAAAQAAPFAMVTDLKGAASAKDGEGERKLALLAYIDKPTEISVAPETRLAVTYFAGGMQYRFVGPARVALEPEAARVLDGQALEQKKIAPEKAISGPGLSPEQWRRLQQATVVMRDIKSSFSVIAPDRTALLDRQAEFAWQPLEGAKRYRFVLYGADNAILHEATTEETRLRAGEALALEPGRQYRWKVDAIGVARPASASGSFALADQAARERLVSLRQAAGGEAGARAFYATTLEAEGYAYDARKEWAALARDFPDEEQFRARAEAAH